MKIVPTLLRLTLLSLIATVRINAQTVTQVIIFKGTEFVQTSAAGAVVNPLGQGPSYGGPFNFRISVGGADGVDMSVLTPTPQVTLAAGSLFPTQNSVLHNNGFLGYDADNNEWRYGSNHNDYGGPTEAGRDGSFAFGDYGMSVQGATFTLHFPQIDGAHPNIAPTMTLSGGSWVAGRYVVNVNQALTITTNAFTNWALNADAAMELQLEGQNQDGPPFFYSGNNSAPNFLTITIPANTLTADRDYRGHASFYSLMDKQTAVAGLPGSLNAAVYEMSTGFVISTISTPIPGAQATLYRVGHLSDLSGANYVYSEVRDATKVGGVIYAVGSSIAYVHDPLLPNPNASDTGFLWTSSNGLTALPNKVDTFTPNPPFVTASAITADAQYIAGRTRAGGGGNQIHANRITVSGLGNLDLGTLPGFPQNAVAVSISSDGSVLYGFGRYDGTGNSQAVRITASGPTVTAIPFLNVGDNRSFAIPRGISSDGTVALGTSVNTVIVGAGGPDHAGNQAFRYVHGTPGTVTGIPFLGGGTWNGALALSSNGNLALISGNSTAYSGGEVYLYNFTGATSTSLGAPSGQNTPSNIGAMNSDGSMVVLSWGNGPNLVFLRNSSGWHSLTTIMTSAGLNLSNWTIDNIFGMSPDGTLIWGVGTHNGVSEGWIVEFNAGYLANYGSTHDFNGDGKSDILWENTATGGRGFWLMNGTVASSWVDLGVVPTAWRIAATADFNADGKPDILWENTATGARGFWLMNGTVASSWVDLGVVPTAWRIAATADFNADGKPDILWENTATGARGFWLMNGTVASSWVDLGVVPTAWRIAATADFNADGKPDILWENTATGDRGFWLMNGTVASSWVDLGVVPTAWRIAATADFNADGKPDILWENTATGDRGFWLMNGTSPTSFVSLGNVPTDWHITP